MTLLYHHFQRGKLCVFAWTLSFIHSCLQFHLVTFFSRFPFDTKNPIGYFIAGICEYVAMITQAFVLMCIFCFAVGTTLLLISSAEDIKCALINLERSSKAKKNRSKIIMKQLLQLIELRSNAKQLNEFFLYFHIWHLKIFLFFSRFTYRLIKVFADLIQYICLILFTWTLVTSCVTMLLIQVFVIC